MHRVLSLTIFLVIWAAKPKYLHFHENFILHIIKRKMKGYRYVVPRENAGP